MNISTLLRDHGTMSSPLIAGLLRRSECAQVVGNTKSRKSFLVLDLAISVAMGLPFLERYETSRGKVVIYDMELHPATIASRLPEVAAARGVNLRDLDQWLEVVPLRGQDMDLYKLEPQLRAMQDVALCVLDPLYRLLPANTSENDNAAIGRFYSKLDNIAAATGSAMICIHHANKSNQSGMAVTSVGSGAGSMSRAVDSYIILRNHEEDDVVVLDGALRSFPPLTPACYRWNHPVWNPAPELDPAKLEEYQPWWVKLRKNRPPRVKKAKPTTAEIMDLVLKRIPAYGGDFVDSQTVCFYAKDDGLSDRQTYRALKAMAREGIIDVREGKGSEPAVFRKAKKAPQMAIGTLPEQKAMQNTA